MHYATILQLVTVYVRANDTTLKCILYVRTPDASYYVWCFRKNRVHQVVHCSRVPFFVVTFWVWLRSYDIMCTR